MTRVLISGASGLIGRTVNELLVSNGRFEVLTPSRQELDFTNAIQVDEYFREKKPEIVVNLAARVGGILANAMSPVDFFEDNVLIGFNTYKYSRIHGVKKIINAGAGCGYPLTAKEPLLEVDLWSGKPQEESIAYSTAKKLLTLMGDIYEYQFDIQSVTIIPSNVYGIGDNFNLFNAHVVPALIHKIYNSKLENSKITNVWGDGSAKRDFIFVEDVAKVIVKLLDHDVTGVVNVATGKQSTISDLVRIISDCLNYDGKIFWDTAKPSGQKSRSMSISKLSSIMTPWNPVPLQVGVSKTVSWFEHAYPAGQVRI